MVGYTQSDDELWRNLNLQARYLEQSSKSFDDGFEDEAPRLAVVVRVLVHDTPSSHSLLGQLGLKEHMTFHNTAYPYDPRNLMPHQGLLIMKVTAPPGSGVAVSITLAGEDPPMTSGGDDLPRGTVTYIARSSGPGAPPSLIREAPFEKWWNEVVIKDHGGHTFTRKDVVLALANKEGGAHVDPNLSEEYANLTRYNSQGWKVMTGGIVAAPDNSITAASMRQIAYEMAESVKPYRDANLL